MWSQGGGGEGGEGWGRGELYIAGVAGAVKREDFLGVLTFEVIGVPMGQLVLIRSNLKRGESLGLERACPYAGFSHFPL